MGGAGDGKKKRGEKDDRVVVMVVMIEWLHI